MELVTTEKQIIKNVSYLQNALSKDNSYAKKLVANGRCFYVLNVGKEYEFYPSRFIGYVDMSIEKHNNSKHYIDGRDTNAAIIKIIGKQADEEIDIDKIDALYKRFCREVLSVEPSKSKRRFWVGTAKSGLTRLSKDSSKIIKSHLEGEKIEFTTLRGKRVPQAVTQAKELFRQKHNGKLFCEICGFDFEKVYGKLGKDFIEAHHINPIGTRVDAEETKVGDFKMLCSNCHRIVHRGKEMLTVEELKVIIKKQKLSIK